MSKIKLEDIQVACELAGWTCESDKYTNLNTPMQFRCNDGHLVELPWNKVRTKFICPVCVSNLKKKTLVIQPQPKTEAYRILALDQATYTTGYAIYDDTTLIAHGVFTNRDGTPFERIVNACDWLSSMISAWQPDEVGLEEVQYNAHGDSFSAEMVGHNTFKMLAQLMGALMLECGRMHCEPNTVLISTWRHHCGVRGRTRADKKKSSQLLVKQWHNITVTDDESDAICIGKYFADTHAKMYIGEQKKKP